MRALIAAIVCCTWSSLAWAQGSPADMKSCTLAAAENLPRIAGLIIKSSKTRTPPPANIPGARNAMLVDIAVSAAGQSVTYTFLCALTDTTPPQIVQIGGAR